MSNHLMAEKYYPVFVDFLLSQKKTVINIGARSGLTPMQSLAIIMLTEPMPMHKITETFNCDASNVTGIIDGLQIKGLATRFESKEDRRIRMVELKPKGRSLRNKLLSELLGDTNPIFTKLSPDELTQFFILISKISKA